MRCPKCEGQMEIGRATWHDREFDEDKPLTWSSERTKKEKGVLWGENEVTAVSCILSAYRCEECGYVEFYGGRGM